MNPEVVPEYVKRALTGLRAAGWEAYLVGGCVRDMVLGKTPSDFDIATDAPPDATIALFERTAPIGARFGTVLVLMESGGASHDVHVTTYRGESGYADGRRPQEVWFSDSIHDDLSRRDFTMNAIAWDPVSGEVIDPFGGLADIQDALIKAVGDPDLRMREDALRSLRAVRFAAQFDFDIDPATWRAIETGAKRIRKLSAERVRDELIRILAAPHCGKALWMMVELGLMYHVMPELKGADRLAQWKRGAPTLLDHLIQTAALLPSDPELRLAGLLHDVGKMETRAVQPKGRVTYYGHAKAGGSIARSACRRLRLSKEATDRIASLVEMHMSVGDRVTKKGVKRWAARYGPEWVRDLVALGRADAGAGGWDGPLPALDAILAHLDEIESEREAYSKRDLAVDGHDVMAALGIKSGPLVGRILEDVYEHVLDHPEQNERSTLLEWIAARYGEDERRGGDTQVKRARVGDDV